MGTINKSLSVDTLELDFARGDTLIEHTENDVFEGGVLYTHKMSIPPHDLQIMFTICKGKVLLESFMIQDVRLGFWTHTTWEPIKPFTLTPSYSSIIPDDMYFKNWMEYFSIEAIKNYVIEQGADKEFLTKEGLLY